MNISEIKLWAKEKVKGHEWDLFVPIVVASILTNLNVGGSYKYDIYGGESSFSTGINLGIFLGFVGVGLAYILTQFIKGKSYQFTDLFKFANDIVRIFIVNLLKAIFVFLWALLLVIPGIIKAFSYAMVDLILGDEKYKDMTGTSVLKLSEEMMNGHKMDYFVLVLSFIGWHILAIFTLGILEFWILPWHSVAVYKFLIDVKEQYEIKKGTITPEAVTVEEVSTETVTCPSCGSNVDASSKFCTNCGAELNKNENDN